MARSRPPDETQRGCMMATMEQQKQDLRAQMRQRRSAIDPQSRSAAGPALADIWRRERPVLPMHPDGTAVTIAGFWPIGDEIDVRALLHALHADGYITGLPVTPPAPGPLAFRAWAPGSPLVRGPFGTSEPTSDAPTVEPDALLVPLLAIDGDGYRLGYGGGYYDRTLAVLGARRRIIAIGVGFEAQRVERLPRGPDDHRLDWLLTERRLLAFA